MTTLGLIGAGKIGSAVAHLAIAAGLEVVISNSRGPQTLVELVAELGDSARAGTTLEAAEAGDVVVVAIPFKSYRDLPPQLLAGKIVIDANNYYAVRDGHVDALDGARTTSAELLQEHLPAARVVKTFNHITAADLGSQGTPAGTANRRALGIAGDDAAAKNDVTRLLDAFGYDTVDAGPLAEGWRLEPGAPTYGTRLDRAGLERELAGATRPVPIR